MSKVKDGGCQEYAQAAGWVRIAGARGEEMDDVYIPILANSTHIGGQLQSFDGHVESAS